MSLMSKIANSKIGRISKILGCGIALSPITYEMLNPPAVYSQETDKKKLNQKVPFKLKVPFHDVKTDKLTNAEWVNNISDLIGRGFDYLNNEVKDKFNPVVRGIYILQSHALFSGIFPTFQLSTISHELGHYSALDKLGIRAELGLGNKTGYNLPEYFWAVLTHPGDHAFTSRNYKDADKVFEKILKESGNKGSSLTQSIISAAGPNQNQLNALTISDRMNLEGKARIGESALFFGNKFHTMGYIASEINNSKSYGDIRNYKENIELLGKEFNMRKEWRKSALSGLFSGTTLSLLKGVGKYVISGDTESKIIGFNAGSTRINLPEFNYYLTTEGSMINTSIFANKGNRNIKVELGKVGDIKRIGAEYHTDIKLPKNFSGDMKLGSSVQSNGGYSLEADISAKNQSKFGGFVNFNYNKKDIIKGQVMGLPKGFSARIGFTYHPKK